MNRGAAGSSPSAFLTSVTHPLSKVSVTYVSGQTASINSSFLTSLLGRSARYCSTANDLGRSGITSWSRIKRSLIGSRRNGGKGVFWWPFVVPPFKTDGPVPSAAPGGLSSGEPFRPVAFGVSERFYYI